MDEESELVAKTIDAATRNNTSEDQLSPELASDIAKAAEVIIHQSEQYHDNTVLRAIVAAIPSIGGSLDILIASRGQHLAQERVLYLLSSLSDEMQRVDQNTVKRDFLETEEWYDLVMRAVEASARTRSREKIRYYARILRGAATEESDGPFSPEEYLAVLAELTPREVEVVRAIVALQPTDPRQRHRARQNVAWGTTITAQILTERCPAVAARDLPFILSRLQAIGLIHEEVGAILGYTGGKYLATDTLHSLVDFIGGLDIE